MKGRGSFGAWNALSAWSGIDGLSALSVGAGMNAFGRLWRCVGVVWVLMGLLVQNQAQAQAPSAEGLLGVWVTHDDDTQEPRAHIKITMENGVLSGRIIKTLDPSSAADERCSLCRDDRKNQPILGLEIIRGGVKKNDKELIWEGGRILDPENGEEYRFRIKLVDQGRVLQVRGYLGPFWRTQTWTRL
jgi:uncharacterized protein (DUF2147 family)